MSMSVTDLTGEPVPGSLLELAVRTLLALVLGAVIGVERQWHHKSAGIRTHALLALGAAGFALISHLIISQGLNTAASLWTTAGVGLAIGLGPRARDVRPERPDRSARSDDSSR